MRSASRSCKFRDCGDGPHGHGKWIKDQKTLMSHNTELPNLVCEVQTGVESLETAMMDLMDMVSGSSHHQGSKNSDVT